MNLEEVADELYALPIAEFTAARNDRAGAARAAGDRMLAERIKQLPRPSVVAWLVNQVARRHAEQVRPLLELGSELREATAALRGDELRALTKQRYRLVRALVALARSIAAEVGQPVSADTARSLERTFDAALADADAAAQLMAARLSTALTPQGFGAAEHAELAAVVPIERARGGPAPARLQRAEEEVTAARVALADAEHRQAACRVAAQAADIELTRLAGRLAELRAETARLSAEHTEALRAERRERGVAERAERAVTDARQRLRRAEARRDDLEP